MIFAITTYLKAKSTIMAFAVAISFQIIFSVIWMTAYQDVTPNLSKMKIGLVEANSESLSKLTANQDFYVKEIPSLQDAKDQLQRREIDLIIHLHNDLTNTINKIDYIINDSNPSIVHTTTTSIATDIQQLLTSTESQNQTHTIQVIHPVEQFSEKQIPFMILITFFVSAMIGNMNLLQTSILLNEKFTRRAHISARITVLAVMAVVVALTLTLCLTVLTSITDGHFFSLLLYLTISMFVFLLLAHMSVLLFKAQGIFLNLLFLALQIVTCGALVPLDLLSPFYQNIGYLLPAHFVIEGLMNIIYGGPSIQYIVLNLSFYTVLLIGLNFLIVFIQSQKAIQPIHSEETQTGKAQ